VRSAAEPRELAAELVRFRADVRSLGIQSSADVARADALGDRRGEEALRLALNLRGPGYHGFVCGLEGPDRLERVAALARPMLRREDPHWDWAYVHRFADPSRPRALRLRAGDGIRLRAELEALLRSLCEDLPKAFREEAFETEKAAVVGRFRERHAAQQQMLEEIAGRAGFALVFTSQGGIAIVPVVDGKPIENSEQLRALGAERLEALRKAREALEAELREYLLRDREEQSRLDDEIRGIEREFARRIVEPRLRALAAGFGSADLEAHLGDLLHHLLDHLEPFRGAERTPPFPFGPPPDDADALGIYAVNVVVDNSHTATPPVLVVDSPTYKNLFGTIDRSIDAFGRVHTDFRRIQAGALLDADGGVVVVGAEDVLIEPFVWRILRRALRSGRIEIEAYDPFVGFSPAALRPEPIRVETKVVLVGARWLYEMLLEADSEFVDLFKVLADFAPVVERDAASTRQLCGRIAQIESEEALLPFEAGALDALVELAVREAGDRRKLHLGSERVLDAAREAAARARAAGHSKVSREAVAAAVADRVHRLDRIEEAIREAIARGQLLVDVEGSRIGQVNALSVTELGRHAFGRPARVTAALGMGQEGVVSIDREIELTGATHDKGVLILASFLRDRFARSRPLSLMASVVFEQSYGHVEGDSASLAELVAILSRIGAFELRQDLAVTGSVNQRGEVQAVGALNEKIEGFFDCCRVKGLSGAQGVVFPAANAENILLRDEVADAVAAGCFHLYPVGTVDEALEVLSGCEAGSPLEPETLNYEVDRALSQMAEALKQYIRS
jgi:ATP-dependent Lon protease